MIAALLQLRGWMARRRADLQALRDAGICRHCRRNRAIAGSDSCDGCWNGWQL